MASTKKYIPEEIRNQILLNLPVKSLLRFKCVCKSWNRLISSKSFCYSHLAHNKSSSATKRYLLFDNEDFYSAYLINNESCIEVETADHTGCYRPKLTSFEHSGSLYLNVYGICNGLLCLSDGELSLRCAVYLWNPIARRGKIIPSPYEIDLIEPHGLAFGYHDDDYKVIKIFRYEELYCVLIYSLSTDDWKSVEFNDPDYTPHGGDYDKYTKDINAILVNGVAYFVKEEPCQVVCYDYSYEIIQKVNFPEHFKADSSFTMKAYGKSIALLEYCPSAISAGMVMWILSGKLMWEKRFSIDLKDCYPLGFIDDGKIMVRTCYSNEFMLFNLETNQFTELKFRQRFETLEKWNTLWGINSFVESLVLLDKITKDKYIVKERFSVHTAAFTLQKWKTENKNCMSYGTRKYIQKKK
ncbi:F-box/kelch-repeat protein At3g23880-like [Apium graveolens]|uniref:F-box/kelch-repeat protein At3g23880-like n=1 Tax=Apium graveolens TaxID=4045 RepID=UPI003D792540